MKVIIVAGPTGTGKTELAIKIAKKFNGELINADSRQVYKNLDIGTNKGNVLLKNNKFFIDDVPIHLINILEPTERFNLFDFQKLALEMIHDISERGKLPIIVGGTGLYIDSLVKGYLLADSNTKDRSNLENLNVAELQKLITKETLNTLNESDRSNPRRLVRVIEKFEHVDFKNMDLGLETFILYPNYNWEDLKQKIDFRVEKMFKEGLIEETKSLIDSGLAKDSDSLRIMGYKQVVEFLNNEIDLNSCKERVKIAHKQYAKRQRTWFEGVGRNYKLNKYSNSDEALNLSESFLKDEV